MITFNLHGDFKKLDGFFERAKNKVNLGVLDKYGRQGCLALAEATPVDTGMTASSWEYEVTHEKSGAVITFYNTNVQNGQNIAILLQYGHAVRGGGYVQGIDYINPALEPVFQKIADEAWKEIVRL
ncbi:MAG: HK97 gp10 family phage protein [Ruminococcus sp.]|nr:HK97 gp10 family phage protein [Ruminococcus sp.]